MLLLLVFSAERSLGRFTTSLLDKAQSSERMTRIPILIYHSIDSSNSVVSISAETFAHHLKVLDDLRIDVISLASAIDALKSRSNIERKAVLTFDDGFENFYNEAFPILSRTKTPATVFLVSDYCG